MKWIETVTNVVDKGIKYLKFAKAIQKGLEAFNAEMRTIDNPITKAL